MVNKFWDWIENYMRDYQYKKQKLRLGVGDKRGLKAIRLMYKAGLKYKKWK